MGVYEMDTSVNQPAPAVGRGGFENTKNTIDYEAQALPTSASGAQPV
jgi:hypothetical protein